MTTRPPAFYKDRTPVEGDATMADRNQGEGNRDAARHYNEETEKFVKSGKVEKAAHEAKQDSNAEQKGRERAKEFDPEEHRDYAKPEKE